MQSGRIKHWNKDKGYGFIDVDNQNEDVFFHVSSVRLSQPITEGQAVYFNSERNDKNQLRAIEVTLTALSLKMSAESDLPNRPLSNNYQSDNSHDNKRRDTSSNENRQRIGDNKKRPLSTLFSLIAIIAIAVYLFIDVPSLFLNDELQTTDISSVSSEASDQVGTAAITGDVQIDNTIALIQQGGPYPYPAKDGTTFYNRESLLPAQSNGYYREYTVPTPGVSHRGARRIVTGGNPPTIYYLTVDHYDSFSQLQVN